VTGQQAERSGPGERGGRAHRAAARPGRLWKRAVVTAVVLVVAFSLGKSMVPALTGGGSGSKSTKDTPPSQVASPPAMADVGGVRVPGTGGALLMLNPGLVRPGSTVQVLGSGFDPRSTVDIRVGRNGPAATAHADKGGYLSATLPFPARAGGGGRTEVVAKQRGGAKSASAVAIVAQGVGSATLSAMVGRPGDTVGVTAHGFAPNETVAVYWGRTTGDPDETLQADSGGSLSRAPVRVGVAPVGVSSLFLVGRTSGISAGVPFQVIGLYPSIAVKPYAVKAQQPISFSGKGFAPGERVLVYLNSVGGQPLMAVPSSQNGTFSGAGLTVPYALTGQQSLVFIGEQSRATAKTGFTVLPYMPSGRPSVYGGLPGTSLSFYAQGFAPNEAVHVYAGRTKGSAGTLVAAFRVDGSGRAAAAGQYTIPGDAPDQLTFAMVGMRSNGTATATIKVDHSGGPVNIPPAPPYHLPKDLER